MIKSLNGNVIIVDEPSIKLNEGVYVLHLYQCRLLAYQVDDVGGLLRCRSRSLKVLHPKDNLLPNATKIADDLYVSDAEAFIGNIENNCVSLSFYVYIRNIVRILPKDVERCIDSGTIDMKRFLAHVVYSSENDQKKAVFGNYPSIDMEPESFIGFVNVMSLYALVSIILMRVHYRLASYHDIDTKIEVARLILKIESDKMDGALRIFMNMNKKEFDILMNYIPSLTKLLVFDQIDRFKILPALLDNIVKEAEILKCYPVFPAASILHALGKGGAAIPSVEPSHGKDAEVDALIDGVTAIVTGTAGGNQF